MQAKWGEILNLIPERDQKLSSETARQQNNERLRVQFAQMANQVGEWVNQRSKRLVDIGMNASGTLENQLKELQSLNEEIHGFKDHFMELDKINHVRRPPFISDVYLFRLIQGCNVSY